MNLKDKLVSYIVGRLGNNRVYAEYYKRSSKKADYTRQAVRMHAKEIKDWTRALVSATDPDNPRRGELMRFYQNMMTDLHLGSCVDNRILPVQCAPFKLVDDSGNEDTDAHKLLEKPWFLELARLICLRTFEGTQLIEMIELNEKLELKEVSTIPQSNFLTYKGVVIKEEYDEDGINYKDGPLKDYYLQVGSDWDLGLFSQLAIIVLAKKLGLGSWMGYIDKFGVPPIFAITDRMDTNRRDELFEMLENFRQNQFAVLQGNEKIEVPNNYQLDAHNTFRSLIVDIANTELSKRVLGGTGTSDEKSYVGAAEVHERLLKYRHMVDKLMFKFYYNEEVRPRLVKLSPVYAPLEKLTLEWDESETLTLKEYIEAIRDLSTYYEFDIKELAQITGLPIIKVKSLLGLPTTQPEPSQKKKPDAKVGAGPAAKSEPIASWDKTIDHIAKLLHEGKLKPEDLNRELILQTYSSLSQGAQQGWGTDFFEFNTTVGGQTSIQQQLRDNLFWFSGAKTYQQLQEINDRLLDENGKVRSWNDFRNEALGISNTYNQVYLETEHASTLNSAHSARDWQQFEANKDVYPRLKYRTMEDADVRDDHASMNGTVKPVGHSYWDTYTPPNGYRCRCWLEQTTEPETDAPDMPLDYRFANNPGKTGEAFTVLHPYFQMPKEQLTRVKNLTELTKLYAPYQKVDGAQVWVNHFADPKDLHDNLSAAQVLAANHAVKVKIRPHIEPGRESIRNPEFYISDKTADLKRISGRSGFENGFKSAHKQGCSCTVFRLDYASLDTVGIVNNLSRVFSSKKEYQPKIEEFYLIWGDKSVKITKQDVLSGKHVALVEKLNGK